MSQLRLAMEPLVSKTQAAQILAHLQGGKSITPLEALEYPRGWGWPGASRKPHYFVDAKSLCGKWMFSGKVEDNNVKSKDDCVECTRRLAKRRAANVA